MFFGLFIAAIVFLLLWLLIYYLPVPAAMPQLPNVLRILLIVATVVYLLSLFWAGTPAFNMRLHGG